MTTETEALRDIFAKWRRSDHMQLHGGEMTAQERRSVVAVLKAVEGEVNAALSRPSPAVERACIAAAARGRELAEQLSALTPTWEEATDEQRKQMREVIRAALAAAPGRVVPEGWRLVLEEPTQEIEDAIIVEIQRQGVAFDDFSEPLFPRALYRVAVSTAPPPPVPAETDMTVVATDDPSIVLINGVRTRVLTRPEMLLTRTSGDNHDA